MKRAASTLGLALLVAGCGSSSAPRQQQASAGIPKALLAAARPIGSGPRFQPVVRGPVTGACTVPLGQRLHAHIEIFGANRVVLLPAGIGTQAPRHISDGRLVHARCFGDLVTLDPTGVIYFRAHERLTVGDVFSGWGQPLSVGRIASFTGSPVRVYVNGRRRSGSPRAVPLTTGAEIVLEVGPRVPPHSRFSFAPAPAASLR